MASLSQHGALTACGHCNELPQTWRRAVADIGSLTVLEADNPKGALRAKIKGLAGLVPSRRFRGEPSLLAAGGCRGHWCHWAYATSL